MVVVMPDALVRAENLCCSFHLCNEDLSYDALHLIKEHFRNVMRLDSNAVFYLPNEWCESDPGDEEFFLWESIFLDNDAYYKMTGLKKGTIFNIFIVFFIVCSCRRFQWSFDLAIANEKLSRLISTSLLSSFPGENANGSIQRCSCATVWSEESATDFEYYTLSSSAVIQKLCSSILGVSTHQSSNSLARTPNYHHDATYDWQLLASGDCYGWNRSFCK